MKKMTLLLGLCIFAIQLSAQTTKSKNIPPPPPPPPPVELIVPPPPPPPPPKPGLVDESETVAFTPPKIVMDKPASPPRPPRPPKVPKPPKAQVKFSEPVIVKDKE